MKHHTKLIVFLAIAAVSSSFVLAQPVAAKNQVPFKGTIRAVEESFPLFPPDVPFPTLFVEASGSGVATQLGKFTITYENEVNLNTFFGIGVAEFVAANGDRITTNLEGQGTEPTEGGISIIFETHTITGGTGRFRGAAGCIVVVRVLNVLTGVTSGVFGGTIVK